MSASRLIRWSGLAAILGAAFIVLARVIQVVLFGESQLSLQAGSDASVLGLGVPGIIGSLGFLLGLIGLYACQAEAAGRFGLLAFLAAFVGVCLSLGANWTYAFASPFIRSLSPEILDIEFTDAIWGALGTSLGVSYLWGAAGWLLMGVSILTAGVLSRWVGGTVLASIVLAAMAPLDTVGYPGILLNVLLAAGPAAIGYALMTGACLRSEPSG